MYTSGLQNACETLSQPLPTVHQTRWVCANRFLGHGRHHAAMVILFFSEDIPWHVAMRSLEMVVQSPRVH